ncbi:MAG: LysM peptidoglycan-binding domain-containing protein [Micrococcaceae bacterium]
MFVLLALMVAAVLIVDVFGSSANASNSDSPMGAVEYTVGYGDTLWGIAGQLDLDSPRTEVVQRIGELNQLSGSEINVGDTLFVPASLGQ